ncbi:MAG: VWA domain-containing protein [Acidobacteriia bacterium]|nr:VWA domain-containing protein [Terriglobia bacterium]
MKTLCAHRVEHRYVFGFIGVAAALLLAGGLVVFSAASPQNPPVEQAPTIKVPVELVNVFFLAKDKHGGLISDLNRNEVNVQEDGRPQQVSFFEKDTNVPLTIALMLDTSGSIQEEDIFPLEQEGAIEFLHTVMRQGDLSLVIHFDLDVELDQDFTDNFTLLEKAIKSARINTGGGGYQGPVNLPSPGGTHLYDGIVLACNDELREEAGRKVMVLVTDGEDQGSKYRLNDAVESAQKANTMIYTIFFEPRRVPRFSMGYPPPMVSGGNTGVLNKLANETGGKSFFPRNLQDMRKAYNEINDQLHSQYRLGYTPSNTVRDGSYRKINLSCSRSDVKIVARKGYYAPRENNP